MTVSDAFDLQFETQEKIVQHIMSCLEAMKDTMKQFNYQIPGCLQSWNLANAFVYL